MLDSLICDYNYKCLDRKECPHDNNCKIYSIIVERIKRKYQSISNKKNSRGYDHKNASKNDLRQMYAIALRSGFKCPYCGFDMTLEMGYTNTASIDHVVARSLGGDNSLKNMKLCCRECNMKKAKVELPFVVKKMKEGITIKDIISRESSNC